MYACTCTYTELFIRNHTIIIIPFFVTQNWPLLLDAVVSSRKERTARLLSVPPLPPLNYPTHRETLQLPPFAIHHAHTSLQQEPITIAVTYNTATINQLTTPNTMTTTNHIPLAVPTLDPLTIPTYSNGSSTGMGYQSGEGTPMTPNTESADQTETSMPHRRRQGGQRRGEVKRGISSRKSRGMCSGLAPAAVGAAVTHKLSPIRPGTYLQGQALPTKQHSSL